MAYLSYSEACENCPTSPDSGDKNVRDRFMVISAGLP